MVNKGGRTRACVDEAGVLEKVGILRVHVQIDGQVVLKVAVCVGGVVGARREASHVVVVWLYYMQRGIIMFGSVELQVLEQLRSTR